VIADESPSMLDLARRRLIEWVSQDLHLPMHQITRIVDSLGDEIAQEIRLQLRAEVERLRMTVGDLIAISDVDAVSTGARPDELVGAPLSLAG